MRWYVESFPNGRKIDGVGSDGQQFEDFDQAFSELKRRRAAGIEEVRIMGPSSATDEQRQAIVAAGGVPTFG